MRSWLDGLLAVEDLDAIVCLAELRFRSWRARWLVPESSGEKSALRSLALRRVAIRFFSDRYVLAGNFWGDLNENKRRLGMFVGKVRTIARSGTFVLFNWKLFLYKQGKWMHNACKHEAKPTRSEVKVKGNNWRLTQRYKQKRKWTKSYHINLVCSVGTGKYLHVFLFSYRSRSFVGNFRQTLSRTELA